jgi:hypothetical protein
VIQIPLAVFAKPSHHSAWGLSFCLSLTTSTPSYDRESTMRKLSRPFSFSSFRRRKRCPNCNSDLSAEDLDLKSVARCFGQQEVHRSWKESAKDGCIFCCLVTAVEEDARQRYGFEWWRDVRIGHTTDGQYLLHLISTTTGLPHTLLPTVVSTTTVLLKGKTSPIDRHVLKYQHNRFQSDQPLGEL